MARNKLSRKGTIARLVTGSVLVATAATVSLLSPLIGFGATNLMWCASAGTAALGLTLGGFAVAKLKKISKTKLSDKEVTQTRQTFVEPKLESDKVVKQEKVQKIVQTKQPSKAYTMDDYRTRNEECNTFAIYEVDGKTCKRDAHSNNMRYKIAGDENYEKVFRNYLISNNSGDCVVKIKDENGATKDYFVHGDRYAVEFPRREILSIVSRIRSKEVEKSLENSI